MLLHARAVLVQHAKIVIGELQVIFGVDAIPLHLRVTREILVFLVELIRIAPRAVVDAIATLRVALLALSATAPTAAGLRAEERRVGQEGVSTCRSRWPPDK